MSIAGGGGVFVSYRRDDSSDAAGRLADRLIDRFGAERVFIDVETIEPGLDFAEAITGAVKACKVLVAVIGPGWLSAVGKRGRGLNDPDDWVRVEIATALARGVRVIPVLVRDAVMPDRGDLPKDLAGLALRAALRVRHESFRDDSARLVAAVAQVLSSAEVSGSTARPAGNAAVDAAMTRTGVTRDNVAHATRLFREAVSIANSILAERAKAQAQSGVGRAMAAFDPSQAARLFNDAERTANSITSEPSKNLALRDVAGAMAVTDPGRAEHIANSITDEPWKALALSDVAGAVAVTDPGRAERIANSIDKSRKAQALCDVAVAIAVTDPGRAERIANSYATDYWKALALSAVAGAVAATDPGRAARLCTDAEHLANPMPDTSSTKALMLSAVAGAVAATDPGRAARLSRNADHIANSITNEFDREMALRSVAGVVAATDAGRAEHIANSITRRPVKAEALRNVAVAIAATDPGRAEHIANSITTHLKAQALGDVAAAMAATDPGRAERIANSITDASTKALALARIADALISG